MRRSQPQPIANRVVAITGGARGIGLATAIALARQGARVAIGDLDGDLALEAAEKLGGAAIGLAVDVTDAVAFTAFLDEVERQLGALDVLVNNAGIMPTGPIEDEDDAMTARHLAINLHAVIHGTREAVRRMRPRGTGHIVNISSAAGRVPGARAATYCATKFGVAGFSESVAQELHGSGIEISIVLPSLTNTELVSGLKAVRGLPWIEPEDVAAEIAATLERPRFEVPVPRAMGALLKLNQVLPYRARSALARITKAGTVLSEIDDAKRAAYVERLERVKDHA